MALGNLLVGIVGGGILSLKSTFLPYVGTVALIPYFFSSGARNRSQMLDVCPFSLGLPTVVTVAAWMVAMKHTSGTYLFPILGHGFDYSSYGLFSSTLPRFSSSHAVCKNLLAGRLPSCCLQDFNTCRDSTTENLASVSAFYLPPRLRSPHSITKVEEISSGAIILRNSLLPYSSFTPHRRPCAPESSSQRKQKTVYGLLSLPGKLHLLLRPGRRRVQAISSNANGNRNSIRTTCVPA